MQKFVAICLLFAFISISAFAQLKSPDEFLPHTYGEHFTPHHLLVDYFYHVADNSPLVTVVEYGRTNQDRPLILAFVSSEQNLLHLEDIRNNNLKIAGLQNGNPDTSLTKAIVWLSFSVHGNEAAGSESSFQVIYDLANPSNFQTKKWLDNTVVVLDPSINPDGYSRYTHWVRNVTSDKNNPDIQDIEHREPWPGGRVNHYLFDLNRDWAWQTQVESRQRMEVYNRWLPHVHADLHEMGHESPYYFAPAAKPYHSYITKWQRDFQITIGQNHAKYFDKEGWLYFTKEVFDLFYPSYGDTYPVFSGAIGMTYEEGGGSVGGRGVTLKNGEILTLKDRIDHHKTTALSTIEITSNHAAEVTDHFHKYFEESTNNPVGKYKSYVIKKDASGNRLYALCVLLDKQNIRYGTLKSSSKVTGFDYQTRVEGSIEAVPGDLIISAFQPRSVLTQVLFDPENELEDSLTYDITAWSLPYAYGLEALATTNKIIPDQELNFGPDSQKIEVSYAYLVPWNDMESPVFLAHLLQNDISVRYTPKPIQFNDREFKPGTLVITKADNKSNEKKMITTINEALNFSRAEVIPVNTGFAQSGPDLGSGSIDLMQKPKVLTLLGDGIRSNSYGQIKWYFDKVLKYPLSAVDIDRFSRVDLTKYNTLILPDGFYKLSAVDKKRIGDWVRQGGKVIAIGRATGNFVDDKNFSLKKYVSEKNKKEATKAKELEEQEARYFHQSDNPRRGISSRVPGAIFRLTVDSSHPLGFGLSDHYYSLRTSGTSYPLIVNQANVMYHPKEGGQVIGFAGSKIRKKLVDSVVFAVESKGRGQVIYMADNPLFRGFWYNGLFVFSNALFMVN